MRIVVLLGVALLAVGSCSSSSSVYEETTSAIELAEARVAAGDVAGMNAALEEALDASTADGGWYHGVTLGNSIDLRLSAGDVDGAKADLESLEVWLASHPGDLEIWVTQRRAAVAAALLRGGRPSEAVEIAEKIGPDYLKITKLRDAKATPAVPVAPVYWEQMDVVAEVFLAAGRAADAAEAWSLRLVTTRYVSGAQLQTDLDGAQPIFEAAGAEDAAELRRVVRPLIEVLARDPMPPDGDFRDWARWDTRVADALPDDDPFAGTYRLHAVYDRYLAASSGQTGRSPPETQAAAATAGQAQSCSRGPRCADADSRATALIGSYSVSGAAPAAGAAYCSNKVVAEVPRICAVELREMGQPACADLADEQAAASESTAAQNAGVAAGLSAAEDWTMSCGWE